MTIAFIGGGNMASALLRGMLSKGYEAHSICVYEISPERRKWIVENLGVRVFDTLDQNIAQANCIVIAVKPQNAIDVAKLLAEKISDQLIVTIAAGIQTKDLSRWLGGHERIVRVMPNTPAFVGSGISALFGMAKIGHGARKQVEAIFSTVGSIFWVEDESQMDAVTAVTGSGPGYVFYFIEALQDAAQQLGFSFERARQLSIETFFGSALLARKSPEDITSLRAQVTSKGGTTEVALRYMEKHRIKQHIIAAVLEAERKSHELGVQLAATEK